MFLPHQQQQPQLPGNGSTYRPEPAYFDFIAPQPYPSPAPTIASRRSSTDDNGLHLGPQQLWQQHTVSSVQPVPASLIRSGSQSFGSPFPQNDIAASGSLSSSPALSPVLPLSKEQQLHLPQMPQPRPDLIPSVNYLHPQLVQPKYRLPSTQIQLEQLHSGQMHAVVSAVAGNAPKSRKVAKPVMIGPPRPPAPPKKKRRIHASAEAQKLAGDAPGGVEDEGFKVPSHASAEAMPFQLDEWSDALGVVVPSVTQIAGTAWSPYQTGQTNTPTLHIGASGIGLSRASAPPTQLYPHEMQPGFGDPVAIAVPTDSDSVALPADKRSGNPDETLAQTTESEVTAASALDRQVKPALPAMSASTSRASSSRKVDKGLSVQRLVPPKAVRGGKSSKARHKPSEGECFDRFSPAVDVPQSAEPAPASTSSSDEPAFDAASRCINEAIDLFGALPSRHLGWRELAKDLERLEGVMEEKLAEGRKRAPRPLKPQSGGSAQSRKDRSVSSGAETEQQRKKESSQRKKSADVPVGEVPTEDGSSGVDTPMQD